MKLGRRVLIGGTALLVVSLLVVSCGDVPPFRWNFGRPTSFAFTKSGIVPVAESVMPVSRSVDMVDFVDYGDLITSRLETADIQGIREANGTLVGTFTPDVFRVPMVKVGFLSSDALDGFWVILSSEGIVGEIEFVDFIEPVYVSSNRLWENIHYDLLFSKFELGVSDIGGVPFVADIQIVAPGYTDTDMPDYFMMQYSGPEDDTGGTIKGLNRQYLGDNRFAVSGGELFLTAVEEKSFSVFANEPGMLLFREEITKPAIYLSDANWTDGRLREVMFGGNEWELAQPFGPGYPPPPSWVDMPFDGLYVGEDTGELLITVSWDLEDIIELWDFGDDGLHFQIAADFIHRFAVNVHQVDG